MILLAIGLTIRSIFYIWPINEEVQFVWQEGLTAVARHLDETPAIRTAAIAGWTPETMDPPTMELTLRRDDLALRYFAPMRTLILPASDPVVILRPAILPLDPVLADYLLTWDAAVEVSGSSVQYSLALPSPHPTHPLDVVFGGELRLLGYDATCPAEMVCQIVTFWRVERPQPEQRRFFMHLLAEGEMVVLDATGQPIQDDGLESNPAYWQAGDLILFRHSLFVPDDGPYWLRLGVYEPESGRRLSTATGTEYLLTPLK